MNAPTKIKAAEVGTDIVVAVTANPGLVLLDQQKFDAFYDSLKAKAPEDVDVGTKKGRDALRTFAADVRSEKARIDKARLALTSEWRDMVDQANAAGKIIKDRLEGLAVEVRKPLTDWEAAEEARVTECRLIIDNMRAAATVTIEDTAASVKERGARVWGQEIDPERFGDMAGEAETVKATTVETLKAALARLTKQEEDAARLAKLEAENAAREAREQAEREERERQELEAEKARQAERRRIDAEKAEAERIERVREEAAQAERDRLQREHDEALAAERRRAEEAEAAAQAERDRVAAEEHARVAEQERLAEEERQREADRAALRARKTETKLALMGCGASEEVAQKIVTAIRAGDVANLEWKR